MSKPLELIREWFNAQTETVKGWVTIAYIVQVLPVEEANLALLSSDENYLAWLGEKLTAHQHVGRTLFACAMIDYMMEGKGDAIEWEQSEETQRRMLESDDLDEGAKETLREAMKGHSQRARESMEGAQKWKQLRSSSLSYDALRAWEDEQMRRMGL